MAKWQLIVVLPNGQRNVLHTYASKRVAVHAADTRNRIAPVNVRYVVERAK